MLSVPLHITLHVNMSTFEKYSTLGFNQLGKNKQKNKPLHLNKCKIYTQTSKRPVEQVLSLNFTALQFSMIEKNS